MVKDIDSTKIKLKEVTEANLQEEHICCAIGRDKVNQSRAEQKKDWLRSRFSKGHRFIKGDLRGKVFIEFSPAEESIYPVEAPGYALIQCFWVSGRYKGHGLGRKLYQECERVCREEGYKGIVAVVAKKKKPFMVDKKVLIHLGFEICDSTGPWYELAVRKFSPNQEDPQFWDTSRRETLEGVEGLDFFYSPACPFNRDFTHIMGDVGRDMGIPVRIKELKTREDLRVLPIPLGVFSVFLNGKLLSAEIMTESKFRALLEKAISDKGGM